MLGPEQLRSLDAFAHLCNTIHLSSAASSSILPWQYFPDHVNVLRRSYVEIVGANLSDQDSYPVAGAYNLRTRC